MSEDTREVASSPCTRPWMCRGSEHHRPQVNRQSKKALRKGRFGFKAHYSTCHEVEVPTPLLTGRRQVKDQLANSLKILGDL